MNPAHGNAPNAPRASRRRPSLADEDQDWGTVAQQSHGGRRVYAPAPAMLSTPPPPLRSAPNAPLRPAARKVRPALSWEVQRTLDFGSNEAED